MSIFKALLEVQKELKPVLKTSDNLYFHSKYADLEAVADAVYPIINKHGVVAIQFTSVGERGPLLHTKLVHAESGEFTEGTLPIITKDSSDPQKVIAGLTYMRRAGLATACGLVQSDDDGNTAAGNDKPKEKEFKEPKPKAKIDPIAERIEKTHAPVKSVEKTIRPTSVVFDSAQPTLKYKIKTEKDGDFYTEKEVNAKLAKQYVGKDMKISMAVDNEFRSILVGVLSVPF